MKRKPLKLVAVVFYLVMMTCFLNPVRTEAATAKQYISYAYENFVSDYGAMETGSYTTKSSSIGAWLNQKGVLSVYTTDLNNDGAKECIVIYTKDYKVGSYTYKSLRIATLSTNSNGKIVKKQDFALNDRIDSTLKTDTRIYVKTYNKKKYLVYQEFAGVDGCSCNTYVFGMNSKGKLKLKLGLIDPGYTSGIGLYKLPSSYSVEKLGSTGYWDAKTLYNSDTVYSVTKSSTYQKRLTNALSKYGLTVKAANTYFKNKHWVLNKTGSMKLLCSIKAKVTYSSGYKYTVSVSDNTSW